MKFALLLAIFALIVFLLAKRIERAFCHLRMLSMCSDCKRFLKKFIVIENFLNILDKELLEKVYEDLKNKEVTDDIKIFLEECEKK